MISLLEIEIENVTSQHHYDYEMRRPISLLCIYFDAQTILIRSSWLSEDVICRCRCESYKTRKFNRNETIAA